MLETKGIPAPEQNFHQLMETLASLIETKGWIELVYKQKDQLANAALFNDEAWVERVQASNKTEDYEYVFAWVFKDIANQAIKKYFLSRPSFLEKLVSLYDINLMDLYQRVSYTFELENQGEKFFPADAITHEMLRDLLKSHKYLLARDEIWNNPITYHNRDSFDLFRTKKEKRYDGDDASWEKLQAAETEEKQVTIALALIVSDRPFARTQYLPKTADAFFQNHPEILNSPFWKEAMNYGNVTNAHKDSLENFFLAHLELVKNPDVLKLWLSGARFVKKFLASQTRGELKETITAFLKNNLTDILKKPPPDTTKQLYVRNIIHNRSVSEQDAQDFLSELSDSITPTKISWLLYSKEELKNAATSEFLFADRQDTRGDSFRAQQLKERIKNEWAQKQEQQEAQLVARNALVFEFLQKNYRAFPKPVQEEIIAYMRDSSSYLDAKKAASYHEYAAELFCIYHPREKESQQFLQGMENKDKAKYKLLLFEQLECTRDQTVLETLQLKGIKPF